MNYHDLLTLKEASEFLGVRPGTLRKWDRERKLNAVRIGSRQDRRYRRADLQAFLSRDRITNDLEQKLYRQEGPALPWFIHAPFQAFVENSQIPDLAVSFAYGYNAGGLCQNYPPEQEMRLRAETVYSRRDEALADWWAHFNRACEELHDLQQEFFTRDWGAISNEELIHHYERLRLAYQYFWNYSVFIDFFDIGVDSEKINYLAKKHDLSQPEVVVLTDTTRLTFFQEYELGLLRLTQESTLSDQDITKFITEYDWIHSSYAKVQHLTPEHVREEVDVRAHRNDAAERIKYLENFALQKATEVTRVLRAHHLKENPLELFQRMTDWRELRKKFNTIGFNALDDIAQQLARRSGVSIEAIYYLAPNEIITLLAQRITEKELRERAKGSVYIYRRSQLPVIIVGKEAESLRSDLERKFLTGRDTDIIQGTVASKGYARGIARIVDDPRHFGKVKEGDILVTSMTRPEFLPVMKLAAGFVTDEGGITSHAAIVAREMGKPCIIGTNVATTLIKDGQLVEVRANHGTVRIVSE